MALRVIVPALSIGLLLVCEPAWAFQAGADAAAAALSQVRPAGRCNPGDLDGCGDGMFCNVGPGRCGDPDAKGTCLPVPADCPETVKPVCGCDGNTYRNRCEAARARISIAHQGTCLRRCDEAHPCNAGEYCSFLPGTCGVGDSMGLCISIPDRCGDRVEPVCGCDGVTYANRCKAALVGVSIAHGGRCQQRCDRLNSCDHGEYCERPLGTCGLNDPTGVCRTPPEACPDTGGPVCGCNGQTYANRCEAAMASVNLSHLGPCSRACGRNGDPACPAGEFCHFPPGGCRPGIAGECRPIPTECPDVDEPVCGCDGVTYDNECFASMAGVPVYHRGGCPRACGSASPCPEGEFCQFPLGGCETAAGVCEMIPQMCPDVWEPVCGCDEMTYSNRCKAAAAGASVAHAGACRRECNPWSLSPTAQCMEGEFCRLPNGACHDTDMLGVCTPMPEMCPSGQAGVAPCRPVCGCDGQTYCSECEAWMAGVSLDHHGECQRPCDPADPNACGSDAYCQLPPGACESEDVRGTCAIVPQGCPDVWEPVCGCDGETYSNACDAAANRVSIRHRGECEQRCGGIAGLPCDKGEFCKLPPGRCNAVDLAGVCRPVADACPAIFDPVCGCDGVTYDNECEADRAQAQIRHRGPCGQECLPPHDRPITVCPDGQFCLIPPASCGSLVRGFCTDVPESCPEIYAPVCGCDGMTYANRCEAWRMEVSVDYDGPCVQPCTSDRPCDEGSFCQFAPGACGGDGVVGECQNIPDACPTIYEPVCGCDGHTYPNRCEAATAGVSIRGNGPCGRRCSRENPSGLPGCGAGEYCQLPAGTCHEPDAVGVCAPRPDACPPADPAADPVCGCDGLTYRSRCAAAKAGVSVDHPGACTQVCGGIAGLPCDAGEFCRYPAGMCHTADLAGVCVALPPSCPTTMEPVCGCDGKTYANACLANRAGAAIDHRGECSE